MNNKYNKCKQTLNDIDKKDKQIRIKKTSISIHQNNYVTHNNINKDTCKY